MSCTDCHSRDSKANVLKTPDLELGAIKYYILMGTMPPLTAKNKVQLSLKEREVLVDCLMIEHLGNLYKTEKKTDGAFVSGTLIKSLLKKECPN